MIKEAEDKALQEKLKVVQGQLLAEREEAESLERKLQEVRKEENECPNKARRLVEKQWYIGYSPYAHKKNVNDFLIEEFKKCMDNYGRDFNVDTARAFCLDGPDVMTTKALNRFGINKVHICNDDRHHDFNEIQQQIVDCKIRAHVFNGTVCNFLKTSEGEDTCYNFIWHDGHGWKNRAQEIDALLDHVAPICLFVVSVQIKGSGVNCRHGPIQHVTVKQELTDSDTEADHVVTDVKEHTEINNFSDIVVNKTTMKNIKIRRSYTGFDVQGRDSRTVFKVLIWVLDAREMRSDGTVGV
jgi:hypothetical protein